MTYKIKELNGKKYMVFENGSQLPLKENKHPHLPKHAGVYLLTDKASGLRYVGTSKNVNKRAHNYTCLSKDLKTRGIFKDLHPEELEFELLEDCKYLPEKDRLKLEAEWIAKLNTIKPNGLNTVMPVFREKKAKEKPEAPKYRNRAGTNILTKFKEL